MVAEGFDLDGHVSYADLGDLDTYTGFGFSAIYYLADEFGVSFNYEGRSYDGLDTTGYGLGIRYTF
jgi:hypothetical protein